MAEGGALSPIPLPIPSIGGLKALFGKKDSRQPVVVHLPAGLSAPAAPQPGFAFRTTGPSVGAESRMPPQIARLPQITLPPLGTSRSVVMRATQPGAPTGTGSGVSAPPSPSWWDLLDPRFMVQILDFLRSLGIRLPWDPKPIRTRFFNVVGGDPMAYVMSPFLAAPEGGSGFGNVYGGSSTLAGLGAGLAGVGSAIGSVIGALRGVPQAMPGGAMIRAIPGAIAGGAAIAGLDWLLGNGGACPTSPFAAGGSSLRATTFVVAHPETGRAVWFKPAGRPLLWSSDLSAARKVRKLAGRARRRVGGR